MTPYPTPVGRSRSAGPEVGAPWQDSAPGSRPTRTRWLDRKPAPKHREKSVADLAAAAVRRANARDCLTILLEETRPLTVGELAARSGLSRPTVDAVLNELIEAGPVSASDPPESHSPGRPARRFVTDPTSTLVAGVDVTADAICCTLTDAAGRIVARTRTALDPGTRVNRFDAVTDAILAAVEQARPRDDDPHDDPHDDHHHDHHHDHGGQHTKRRLAMIGLAVPAIIDRDHRVARSLSLPEWAGIDVGAELSQRLGCPVAVENELRLAALAEHHVGRTAANLIYVQLGRRISVAIMVDGRILHGSHRLAGELDARRDLRWTASYDQGGLTWSTGREAAPLFERAAAGDRTALAEVEDFCSQIAPRLATLILTLDPETVIIAGGISKAGDVLLDPLRQAIDQLLTWPEPPDLVAARLTSESAETGAIGYAFEQGSEQIFGIDAMPAPWCRLRDQPATYPRQQAGTSGAQ